MKERWARRTGLIAGVAASIITSSGAPIDMRARMQNEFQTLLSEVSAVERSSLPPEIKNKKFADLNRRIRTLGAERSRYER